MVLPRTFERLGGSSGDKLSIDIHIGLIEVIEAS